MNRPTPNQIKLQAAVFADSIFKGGSQRNIDAIAAYGDCLRNPYYTQHRIPNRITNDFYRALISSANEEMMAFSSGLVDDEDRLELLENEVATLMSQMAEDKRKAEQSGQNGVVQS